MFESVADYAENIENLIDHLKYEKIRSSFLSGIIKKYNCLSAIKDELKDYVINVEGHSLLSAKQFTYNNSIISLYGFFENFLESLVNEYIYKLNEINAPFALLPNEIRRLHLESSIELLKKIQRNRGQSSEQKLITIRSVVGNMNSCIHEMESYQLNEKAFSIHSSNFRYDTVHNLFCKIGIQGLPKMALRNPCFKKSIIEKHATDPSVDQKILVTLLTSELDDLAQRRNEIAHGSFDGEIESVEIVIQKSLLFKEFGLAINQILTDHIFHFLFMSSAKVGLGAPARVFNNIKAFGFLGRPIVEGETESEVSVGDTLFAENENSSDKLKYGKVISIMNQGIATDNLRLPSATDFSIKVDFDLTSHMVNRDIYIVTAGLSA